MEFFGEIISILFDALLIYFAVQLVMAVFGFRRFLEDVEANSQQIREHLNSIIHPVKSETHNGIMYWFDAEDDTFLAQGRDDVELAAALKARWIDHIFIIGDRYLMAGPDFEVIEIKDPDEIGRMLADKMITKKEANESRKAS